MEIDSFQTILDVLVLVVSLVIVVMLWFLIIRVGKLVEGLSPGSRAKMLQTRHQRSLRKLPRK